MSVAAMGLEEAEGIDGLGAGGGLAFCVSPAPRPWSGGIAGDWAQAQKSSKAAEAAAGVG